MRAMRGRAILSLIGVAGAVLLGACVDEDVVFDERPGFQEVAVEAGGFVGYADPSSEDRLTFCGTCHTDLQTQWEGTAHADAWLGLAESDHARAFCEACHAVTSLGNVVPEPDGAPIGGHAAVATPDGRYHDVQCEACHGPGLEHVLDPGNETVPLAPATVGLDLSFGCGECHQGFHHPFTEEWEVSAHATPFAGAALDEDDGCYLCHSGEGALIAFGVEADYLEKDELLGSERAFMPITCAVCHDPHGSEFAGDLRLPVETTDPETHLCAVCHDLFPQPDLDGGPAYLETHSPHAGLVAATAGWFPSGSGLVPGALTHPHTGADRLCATCHVAEYEVLDQSTGQTFFSKGHRFQAAPCVDPTTGLPLADQDCPLRADTRDFVGCLECHESEEATVALLQETLDRVLPLARQVASLIRSADPDPSAPGGAIDTEDGRFTVAEGAVFNLSVALSGDVLPPNDERARRALAAAVTHNPALVEALLQATVDALLAEYGGSADVAEWPSPAWWASMDAGPGH